MTARVSIQLRQVRKAISNRVFCKKICHADTILTRWLYKKTISIHSYLNQNRHRSNEKYDQLVGETNEILGQLVIIPPSQ